MNENTLQQIALLALSKTDFGRPTDAVSLAKKMMREYHRVMAGLNDFETNRENSEPEENKELMDAILKIYDEEN